MNGRVYDPKLGRFLQADPFIQAADNTQSYNRYSYVINNPLNATDPSGFIFDKIGDFFKKFAGAIVTAVVATYCQPCGLVVAGMLGGATQAAVNGGNIIKGAVMGMFSGAAAQFGGPLGSALFGGVRAEINGGSFGRSFAAAGVGILGGGNAPGFKGFIRSAVSGGVASKITGGKFANGAKTAAFSWGISRAAESFSDAGAPQGQNSRGNVNCKSPCNGEVTVDFSQLESPEDFQRVADHLESLRGDPHVNQGSLIGAALDVSMAASRSRFVQITRPDVIDAVFDVRFRESQRDVAIFGTAIFGGTAAVSAAPTLTMNASALAAEGAFVGSLVRAGTGQQVNADTLMIDGSLGVIVGAPFSAAGAASGGILGATIWRINSYSATIPMNLPSP